VTAIAKLKPNIFSGGSLDRASTLRRDEGRLATLLKESASKLFPIWRSHSLVKDDSVVGVPHSEVEHLIEEGETPIFLGLLNGEPCFACDISHHELDAIPRLVSAGEFADIRQIGGQLSQSDGALLAFARAMVHWHRTHRFCGVCGKTTLPAQGGHVRRCTNPSCQHEIFPRTDPAVIMLVTNDDHCLLGRQSSWTPGMYSTLAGFVEPGETPEEAVVREVMEETGIQVHDAVYHSSQPWPFPGSLMIGFRAQAPKRARPRIDTHELEAADWFSRADIRTFAERGMSLPRPISIARRLIEDWLAEK
jgi:NAD+ diphosphatase